MDGRNAGIDMARCLAVSLVFLYHAFAGQGSWLGSVCGAGWIGVDLFFVLSGMLVARGYERIKQQGQGPVFFWRKRAWRIVPAYLVAVGVCTGIACAVLPDKTKPWRDLLSLLTFTGNHRSLSAGVLWSISVECQFYALLPLFLGPLALGDRVRRHPWRWLAFFLAVPAIGRGIACLIQPSLVAQAPQALGVYGINQSFGSSVYGSLLLHGDGLLVGLWLGVMDWRAGWADFASRKRILVAFAGGLVWVLIWLSPWRTWMPRPIAEGVLGFTIVAVTAGGLLLALARCRLPVNPGIEWLSDRVYSLYLGQAVASTAFLVLPVARLVPSRGMAVAVIYGAIVFIAASVLYRLVEAPLVRGFRGALPCRYPRSVMAGNSNT